MGVKAAQPRAGAKSFVHARGAFAAHRLQSTAMSKRPKKVRTDFRKNRAPRPRQGDLTRQFEPKRAELDDLARDERLSGKGELTRRRTVLASDDATAPAGAESELVIDVDRDCLPGRVLSVHGLLSQVETADGRRFRCATRRLLKTLATDQRHVVAAGDRVSFRPAGADEGIIERIEPRHGTLSRASRGRRHIIVTNVDQLLIVTSAAEPQLKPNLIDRFLVSAEQNRIQARVVINKVDLVDLAELQPLAGVYGQMGYPVHLVSATTGLGIARLRRALEGRANCLAGQSGVGKSSLLNAIDPELGLRVASVSQENEKGRHTTTSATLIKLSLGGWVIDTPGIRQFQLWDVIPQEVAGLYRDVRPFVSRCRYPDCTHTHEDSCGVKDAVADDQLDARRYESFCYLYAGDFAG